MKRLLLAVLICMMLVSCISCSKDPIDPLRPLPLSLPEITKEDTYTQILDPLSWERICEFPIKTEDMTVEQMRALCVDFFRYCKTAAWIADEDLSFVRNKNGTEDKIEKGQMYGGLPYIAVSSGNIYRLLDYMDPQTGVVDVSAAAEDPKLFGNQCSIGAYWAWGRVINSAKYDWTQNMVESKGFIRVGDYTYGEYGEYLSSYSKERTTTKICEQNGEWTMFQSYAKLKPADGLVYYTTAGHVIMCSEAPVIKYDDYGNIDGEKSYIYIIDQAQKWENRKNKSGDSFKIKGNVDKKMTFAELYKGSYLPFTFAEFLGTDPVEATACSFSFSDDTITLKQLRSSCVTANYGISDVYAILTDKKGQLISNKVSRAATADVRELTLDAQGIASDFSAYVDKECTVQIVCQLSTGERLLVYSGNLVTE